MNPIRYPNITSADPSQQLRQLVAYLRYLAEEVNIALAQLERTQKEE